MKISKYVMRSCCGRTTIAYTLDSTINEEFSNKLTQIGFTEQEHFKKSGILYTQNENFIITGPYGSTRLQLKCRKKDCESNINALEETLKNMD